MVDMSYNAKVELVDGKMYVEVSDDSIDEIVVSALREYRKLLQDSMTVEAEQYMVHGIVQDFQVRSVKENLLYLYGIDRVLDYLGAPDAE
jgi:hypothetical protein